MVANKQINKLDNDIKDAHSQLLNRDQKLREIIKEKEKLIQENKTYESLFEVDAKEIARLKKTIEGIKQNHSVLEESLLDESSNEENEELIAEEGDKSTSSMVSATLYQSAASIVSTTSARSASSMVTTTRGKSQPESNKELGPTESPVVTHNWWLHIVYGGYNNIATMCGSNTLIY